MKKESPKEKISELSFLLKPSTIPHAGIGIFAAHAISKDTILYQGFKAHGVLRKLKDIPEIFHKLCIFEAEGLGRCPANFEVLDKWWFINHAKKPNVGMRKVDNIIIALRDIREGEEILIDYKDLPFGGNRDFSSCGL